MALIGFSLYPVDNFKVLWIVIQVLLGNAPFSDLMVFGRYMDIIMYCEAAGFAIMSVAMAYWTVENVWRPRIFMKSDKSDKVVDRREKLKAQIKFKEEVKGR
jgi:hypothetical protein